MIITGQASVTDEASDFNDDNGSRTGGATSITIVNTGSSTVYLGGSGVTDTTGFPVAAGAGWGQDNVSVNDLFAVCASGESSTLAWIYERNA